MTSPTHSSILIVDDEVDACANLSDILTDLGYRVDVAYDGLSALELVKEQDYDLALLDLKMPRMDGVELCKRIRAISAGTIALIVTAFAETQVAQDAQNAGAFSIISKPVQFPQLIQLVQQSLSQSLDRSANQPKASDKKLT